MKEYNKGILWQMKNNPVISYKRGGGITRRDLALAMIYTFGGYQMKWSNNVVESEEDLDVELTHYQFLRKYNLL